MVVGNKIVTQEIPERTSLSVPKFKGDPARAARAAKMRGFKESLAKAERKEKIYNWLAAGICNVTLGVIVFGMIALALYLGNC